MLRSLAQAELVSQHSQSSRYSLGPGLFRLGVAYRDRLPLLQVLAPDLLEVRDNTKATIEVSLLVQGVVVVAGIVYSSINPADAGPRRAGTLCNGVMRR